MAQVGKFTYAVMLVYFIELAMYMFGGPEAGATSIFNFLFNPSTILSSPLYAGLLIALGAISISAIIVGNLWSVNIYALYTAVVLIAITFVLSIVHLWQFLDGEFASITILDPITSQIILAVVISPLVWFYLTAVLEWVRGNQ